MGLPDLLVTGGHPAAQVVVVHGRQVVVHEAVRVDELEGERHGHRLRGVPAGRLGGHEAQQGPHALAPRGEHVPGALDEEGRPVREGVEVGRKGGLEVFRQPLAVGLEARHLRSARAHGAPSVRDR